MSEAMTVKVSSRCQISVPSAVRAELGIESGDRLLVDVQDGVIILIPQPRDFVEHMAGRHKAVWAGVDTTRYLAEERASWNDSERG